MSRVSAFQRLSECLLAAAVFVCVDLSHTVPPFFPPAILALFMTGVTGRSSHDFPGHVYILYLINFGFGF